VSGYLLDVNVLIALSWPQHIHHARVQRWFAGHFRHGWATCPFTQAAFVRLLSNPSFTPDCLTVGDAIKLLGENLTHSAHRFWADDLTLGDAIEPFRNRLVGHQQVMDAYLLGLALRKKGNLATLDSAILTLLPEASPDRSRVEVIR
jgi:uncharacterized protein